MERTDPLTFIAQAIREKEEELKKLKRAHDDLAATPKYRRKPGRKPGARTTAGRQS